VLSYARFQDIHLSSNVVERWLGLARIEIQTASGSAKAEMTIEGLLEYEAIRDFLYARMRGHHGLSRASGDGSDREAGGGSGLSREAATQIAAALHDLASELRNLRGVLSDRPAPGKQEDRP
jgi:putative membrane protein